MHDNLSKIRFILIRPTHPGNIGACARAMKNMGLARLYLVQPKHFPHEEAITRSSGAEDLLEKAVVVESLTEAVRDCQLIVGTSARSRTLPWPILSARNCAEHIQEHLKKDETIEIAILFGQERIGLTNQELALCHRHLFIPCNPNFYSLNLAAAVQVIAYEIRMACLQEDRSLSPVVEHLATSEEVNLFYEHLEKIMFQIGFMKPKRSRQLMLKLRRFFNRAMLERNELNILRGILTAMGKFLP